MCKCRYESDVKRFLQMSQVYLTSQLTLPSIARSPSPLFVNGPTPPSSTSSSSSSPLSSKSCSFSLYSPTPPSTWGKIIVNHRICTFKYDFHVKIMLQTSQVVLTSSFVPIPPFSPPCLTLPSIFLSETKANYIKSNLKI